MDDLLARGFDDLTVLDVSTAAVASARSRVSADAPVSWIVHDLLTWVPPRTFDLWHDRAVLHFLTADADRQRYLNTLIAATTMGSTVLIGVFAADGPESCSGLPVRRHTAEQLTDLVGDRFTPVTVTGEEHITPRGSAQSFVWAPLDAPDSECRLRGFRRHHHQGRASVLGRRRRH